MAPQLKSAEDLRRYLASLINRVESGDIDNSKAGKLGYLASILVKIIESSDIERRLEAIEKQMKKGKLK